MKLLETENATLLSRKQHDEKIYQEKQNNEQKIQFYQQLQDMGVDLTKYLSTLVLIYFNYILFIYLNF